MSRGRRTTFADVAQPVREAMLDVDNPEVSRMRTTINLDETLLLAAQKISGMT